jgi:hypothetical protein
MFHKSHSIRNCAFCWNSSTFFWHNLFSVNIKRYTKFDQQKFVEKIRNGNHVLHQYTMCHMKSKAGELRACSIVLKTQNSLWKSWQSVWALRKSFTLNWKISCTKVFNIQCILHVWCLLKDREMLCLEGTKKYVYLNI